MKKDNKKSIVTVLGAGNMGTALALVLAKNGHEVRIWNWEGDHTPLQQIAKCHENKKYLPDIKLPKNIISFEKIDEALHGSHFVFFVVPSDVMEHTVSFASRSIKHNAILVDLSKGIEPHRLQIMTTIIAKHVRPELRKQIVTLSGPAIADQMAGGCYTAMNIASKNKKALKEVCKLLENDYIKLMPTSDVVGVEVGGSFKNVYAIAIGICDGLGLAMNTKAALLTYALEEIANLTKAMGGKKETAYQLAGIGDLIGTALCLKSRNRTFGEYLGQGIRASEAIKKMKQTVEGYEATKCLIALAKKYKVDTPFAYVIYACLEAKDPRVVFNRFLERM